MGGESESHVIRFESTLPACVRACLLALGVQTGKTIGVVGLGRIGREVSGWCMNFGMHAIGYDPIITDAAARTAGIEPVSLDEVRTGTDLQGGRKDRWVWCGTTNLPIMALHSSTPSRPCFLGGCSAFSPLTFR